jgi:hypothetical protein
MNLFNRVSVFVLLLRDDVESPNIDNSWVGASVFQDGRLLRKREMVGINEQD